MHPKDIRILDYTYDLPEERIARYPLEDRASSKLLVYNDGVITDKVFRDIAASVPAGAMMVYNQTKVVHARLLFRKTTGGVIEIFCLSPHDSYPDVHTAMLQKRKVLWTCMVGGAGKWKAGIGLQTELNGVVLRAQIEERNPASYTIGFEWNDDSLTFGEVLHQFGKMPLPPYLQREVEASDEDRYQTIFAQNEGSVAAPTAGLHFTDDVFKSFEHKGIKNAFVTLHVGAGTFKPVKSATMETHDMHEEWIDVGLDTIEQIIQNTENPIVAVGTTSLRTLESLYWIGNKIVSGAQLHLNTVAVTQWEPYEAAGCCSRVDAFTGLKRYMLQHNLERIVTRTQILICPGYTFRVVDGLVTNFHQPQSTLLLLVAAFIGDDWRKVYEHALNTGFRFLSYGDGCLLWRKG